MSEKVRSLNLSTAVGGSTGVGTGSTLAIGNPTLISSTLSTNHNLTPTVDLITAAAAAAANSQTPSALNTSLNSGSDMESSTEFAAGTITAQLNFQLIPTNVVDNNNPTAINTNSNSNILDYNSIMNSSQFSAISNDSLQQQGTQQQQQSQQQQQQQSAPTHVGSLSQNSMALVKAGAGKPVVAQSVAGVSFN